MTISAKAENSTPAQPSSAVPNPRLAPILGRSKGSLVVHEIYRSLQGESTYAGWPCVFVRLTACQLRCHYCDTVHAFNQGREMTSDALFEAVMAYEDTPIVELTGGEPLLQAEAVPLMTRLCDAGKRVLVETSGAISTIGIDPRVHVILDVKTPGSGESEAMDWSNLERIKAGDEVKFVICDKADFDWSVEVVDRYELTARCPVHFSPCHGRVGLEELADWILGSRRNIRFQMQLHKVIWGADRRGV